MTEKPIVLVTGANGFVAIHTIVRLLEAGYHVRGTIRDITRGTALRQTIVKYTDADERLELFQADLLFDDGWDKFTRDCTYVLHLASPFPLNAPKDENDLIRPAREGTLRVLRAAAESGVRRVVLTSSIAAIAYGHPTEKTHFDESDWSQADQTDIGAYPKSKTLAEQAAWDFVDSLPADRALELAVINPGLVLGPLPDTHARTSAVLVRTLLQATLPGLARVHFNAVDVRDVAAAHLAAMTHPEAAGQRFICVGDSFWIADAAHLLKEQYAAAGYKVRTNVFPDWMVRLVALVSKEARATVDSLGQELHLDNRKAQRVLGIHFRKMDEMVLDMAASMIAMGMV